MTGRRTATIAEKPKERGNNKRKVTSDTTINTLTSPYKTTPLKDTPHSPTSHYVLKQTKPYSTQNPDIGLQN